jgi:hypothetical protein
MRMGDVQSPYPDYLHRGVREGSVASAGALVVQAGLMSHRRAAVAAPRSNFAGFRFPPGVIMLAVRWYLRYGLSYREVEDLLAERGITVDQVTIDRWVQRFTPELIDAADRAGTSPGTAGSWTRLI